MRHSLLALLLAISPCLAAAQSRPETIRGRVTGVAGQAISGAAIAATMAPDRTVFSTTSDSAGQYAIHVAAGTGDYLLHVTKIGLVPFRKRITRTGNDSVLVADVKLAPIAQQLSTVRVQAQKPKPSRNVDPGTGTGAAEKLADSPTGALSPDLAGDINAIASTIPGVTPLGGGISVLGLDPSQNSTTLNGMAFPSGSFPRAAQTNVRVSTTTYDPARGWFSGANSNLEFSGGSIYSSRRALATIDAPALQFTDPVSARLGQRFTNVNASVGGSGPIDSNDRYFYAFGAQGGHKMADATSLLTSDEALLRNAGVAADSAARLLDVLRAAHIPTILAGVPSALVTDNASLIARFDRSPYDWKTLTPSKTTVALTLFSSWSRARPLSLSPTATPGRSGDSQTGSATAQGLFSTYFGDDYLTTTRSALSFSRNSTSSFLALPSADVLVASTFPDGSGAVSTLGFGGDGVPNGRSDRWTWETTHETQFYTQSKRSLHRVTFSADGRLDGFSDDIGSNALGRFFFNSLTDVAANRPTSFARSLNEPTRRGAEWNGFAALGDLWRAIPTLQVQYGARVEGNAFATHPAYNADIDRAFGVRTDATPQTVSVSPRLGFTWVRRGAGNNGAITFNPMGMFNMGPTSYIRGGIGEFRSMIPATLVSDALVETGLPGAATSVTCIGDASPRPDWAAYLANAGAIPSSCVGGASSSNLSQSAPSVRVVDRSYDAPHSWRGNLSYASQYRHLRYSVDGTYSLNLAQPSLADLNLTRSPSFTSAGDGRAVFVPISAIDPSTGAVSRTASRVDPAFDQVIATRSDGRSVSRQLIFTASPDLFQVENWFISASYVLSQIRARANGFSTTTFDSPVAQSWSRGALDARHQFLLQGGYSVAGLTFSFFAHASSGLPFTPIVGSDVNGDGFVDDRAFIFDPARTADPALASSVRALIAGSPARVRSCLERQLGHAAGQASCEGPWTASMNAALTASPSFLHINNRVTRVQLSFSNPLAGLDQALHGSRNLHGWGTQASPDPVLYQVSGFSPSANRFVYEVNPRFGNTDPARSLVRAPFRMTLDVSVNLSRDAALQQLERYLRPGRAGHPGPRLGVDELVRRYQRSVPDPFAGILQESDSLLLAPEQVTAIQGVQAKYRQSMDSLWLVLATDFAGLGDTFDVPAAVKRQEKAIEDGWEIGRLAIHAQLPGILSPVQLAILPGTAARLLRATGPVIQNGRTLFP